MKQRVTATELKAMLAQFGRVLATLVVGVELLDRAGALDKLDYTSPAALAASVAPAGLVLINYFRAGEVKFGPESIPRLMAVAQEDLPLDGDDILRAFDPKPEDDV